MSKQKMLAARELIQEKRYAEARALLKTIDDPKAQEWLKKLDAIAPEKKKSGGRLVYITAAVVLLAVVVIVVTLVMRQNNAENANQNAAAQVPTQMELPSEITAIPTGQVAIDPKVKEAFTIHCMSVAQLSRQECEDYAATLIVDPDFTETITLCTERYADSLDTFAVCMQDVWNELDKRYNNNVMQVAMLYAYCSGDSAAFSHFDDDICYDWANLVGILSPGWSVAEECWGTNDLGGLYWSSSEHGEEIAVQCLADQLGENFPELPLCDNLFPLRHNCTESLRASFLTSTPLLGNVVSLNNVDLYEGPGVSFPAIVSLEPGTD